MNKCSTDNAELAKAIEIALEIEHRLPDDGRLAVLRKIAGPFEIVDLGPIPVVRDKRFDGTVIATVFHDVEWSEEGDEPDHRGPDAFRVSLRLVGSIRDGLVEFSRIDVLGTPDAAQQRRPGRRVAPDVFAWFATRGLPTGDGEHQQS